MDCSVLRISVATPVSAKRVLLAQSIPQSCLSSCNVMIHQNEMSYASTHDKEMEDFVGTEIWMHGIEQGHF